MSSSTFFSTSFNLYRRISRVGCNPSVIPELQKWMEEGRRIKKFELQLIIKELRKYGRHAHALQISEWIVGRSEFTKGLSDHAVRLDLIAKVRGIASAESYFNSLPEIAKVEPTYGALLNSYVTANMTEKAEALMEKIEELGYARTSLPYNQLLTLYKKTGKFDKVPSVLEQMKRKNISQDKFTYNIRMNICAAMSDIDGMEKVLLEMKYNPMVNTDWSTYGNLANIYIKAGLSDKAQAMLQEMEMKINQWDRELFIYLITLYAGVGNKDGVNRMWQSLKSAFPKLTNMNFICMLDSLVKLDDLEGAEKLIEEWESAVVDYDFRVPNILLKAYVNNGLVEKAELFVELALDKQRKPICNTWEILAEGYLKTMQLDKATQAMDKALSIMKQDEWKPKPANVQALLKHFQECSDMEHEEQYHKLLRDMNFANKEYKESCDTQ
ncbi:large ribosomal subunit protein mL101 (rPPR4) [Cryptomeria japonica]|uniref:large ribosomal subunit protein mL101 (rPPR4) n=1 Tax=Cryptomeria japonica TaxID=3369 RepID=UPI0027D9FC26|nr:large ribosomal subunit protein mL101 (rPPR4) [Cryptomeria japonica]